MKILARSTIQELLATILVACSFCSFATALLLHQQVSNVSFCTDFGALPGPRPIAPRDDIDISLCVWNSFTNWK